MAGSSKDAMAADVIATNDPGNAVDGTAATAAGFPSTAPVQHLSIGSEAITAGASPSITHPQTRHEEENQSFPPPLVPSSILSTSLKGTLNFDWWDSAGCVMWATTKSNAVFDELQRCQHQAELCHQPIPCSLGDGQIFVHERGMGSGRDSRREFRLEWCGATVGLSHRPNATRKLYNFSLTIPGEPCLVHGCSELRNQVLRWLEEWGGQLDDEWLRRLDLCLDVVGLDLRTTILPAFKEEQFISTASREGIYRFKKQATGFGIGSEAVYLRIYDKLKEVLAKGNGTYTLAMTDRRWGGEVPQAATRIEYQLKSEFFRQFGLKTAAEVESNLAEVIGWLTQVECRPFFELTDAVPDREGRHQGRVGILPEWTAIISSFREQAGQPRHPLKRLRRGLIDTKRACANAVGYLTSAAAQLGRCVENRNDLLTMLADLLERHEVHDDQIRLQAEDKARRCGTFNEMTSFPYGNNLAA